MVSSRTWAAARNDSGGVKVRSSRRRSLNSAAWGSDIRRFYMRTVKHYREGCCASGENRPYVLPGRHRSARRRAYHIEQRPTLALHDMKHLAGTLVTVVPGDGEIHVGVPVVAGDTQPIGGTGPSPTVVLQPPVRVVVT